MLERRVSVFDFADFFSDPDGDPLTYVADTDDPQIVRATVTGSKVTLTSLRDGAVMVSVTASDPGGLSVTQKFMATVRGFPFEPPAAPTGLRVAEEGTNFIEWRWDEVEGATGYEVQFSINDTFSVKDSIHLVDQTYFRRTGLEPGMSRYLRVRSLRGSGENPLRSTFSPHVRGMTVGDRGDTEGTATAVRVPSTTRGEVAIPGDIDYFRFELRSAGELTVYTTGLFDTYGVVTGPNNVRRENDDGPASTNFTITIDDAPAGVYFVEVRGYYQDEVGEYVLHVEFTGSVTTGQGDHRIDDP